MPLRIDTLKARAAAAAAEAEPSSPADSFATTLTSFDSPAVVLDLPNPWTGATSATTMWAGWLRDVDSITSVADAIGRWDMGGCSSSDIVQAETAHCRDACCAPHPPNSHSHSHPLSHTHTHYDDECDSDELTQQPTFFCAICCDDEVEASEQFTINPCGHSLCKSCAHDSIMSDLRSRKFPLLCPICKAEKALNKPTKVVDAPAVEEREEGVTCKAEGESGSAASSVLGARQSSSLVALSGRGRKGAGEGLAKFFTFNFWKRREAKDEEVKPDTPRPSTAEEDDAMAVPEGVTEITFGQAFTVLNEEEQALLDRLSLTFTLDRDARFLRCPFPQCEGVVFIDDADHDDHRPLDRNVTCPRCAERWCRHCKCATVHEGMTCEKFAKWRKRNEGVDVGFEELITREGWRRCPKCQVVTSKMQGCNKMVCDCCKMIYCFLCGKTLDKKRPYLHYTRPFSTCYNKLFDDIPVAENRPLPNRVPILAQ
ncbi:E3 ubiquitin-protein ligase rnf14 [Irineochytrium annulatum]|nr:E3 ubiquitin-protein ligase rnf14 [Irineochytrium annulatum]